MYTDNIDNYMARPLDVETMEYHKITLTIKMEREILVPLFEDIDKAVDDAFEDMVSDPSDFDYDWNFSGYIETPIYK